MRVERLVTPALFVAASMFALVSVGQAQSLTGYAQGQYQIHDQNVLRNGVVEHQRVERWVQSFELQHFATPRNDLRVMSSFRLSDLSYRGLPDQSRSPQGSFQVTHPWANLFAAYRPTTVTGGLGPAGVIATADTGRTRTLTSRAQETLISGQIAPPSWPRLDVAWTRRHRDRDELSPEESGVTRTARMAWSTDQLNLYSSLADQHTERSGVRAGNTQRTAAAGGALHLAPRTGANVDLAYDFTDSKVGDPLRNGGSGRGHNASLNAAYRVGGIGGWSSSWLWRRTESRGPRGSANEDHEGTLQYSLDPRGPFRFTAASGARTLREPDGTRPFATSLSGVAALEGRVRTGWNGTASLTHVTNWEPSRGHWSVEAARAGSRMTLARGLEIAGDAQVSTSDDTTLRDVNTTTEGNVRARLSPWRAFTAGWTARLSRLGDGVLQGGAGAARSTMWDARWRPLRTIELTGTTASAVARGGANTTTRTAGMRWWAHPKVQLMADWSRSNDARTTPGTQLVSGREIASAHVLAMLTRKIQLDASAGVADRDTPRENRQGTVTVTWAFGR